MPFAECLPPGLEPDIIAVPYVPFSRVLPRCAAIIYHGGIGTCAQALHAGIPQLVQPMAHDQLDTLSRIRELGVGDGVMPRNFKEKPLAAALERLLSTPSYQENATRMAEKFRTQHWVEETCRVVEGLK